MSDLVSRVAARAIGRTAAARPRLPSLFEPAGEVASLEVVEEVVVRRPRSLAPPADGHSPPQPDASRPSERGPHAPRPARPAQAPARRAAARERPSPAASSDRTPAVTLPRNEPGRQRIVEERVGAEGATVLVAAAAPAAVAAAPAALAKQPAPPDPKPPRSAAPAPPVRVHIGRLEVRATLQEPPRPRLAAERPQQHELSLGDYLRGRKSGS